MTLGQFSAAVPAPKKWVQNAFAVLGLDADYSVEGAKRMALARVLETEWSIPLKRAHDLAVEVLSRPDDTGEWQVPGANGVSTLSIDRDRVLSNFAVTLSLALESYAEQRRGRPKRKGLEGFAAAAAYGVDISLLEASLDRTPAERLRRLDRDAAFVSNLKVVTP